MMQLLSTILVLLVIVEHFYFLVLEMFYWTKPLGLKTFGKTEEEAESSKVLAMNMGLYNGFLAVGLLWGLLYPIEFVSVQIQLFFLVLIIIAGVFGGLTAKRSIIFIQALPAALAAIFVLMQ